MGNRGDEQMIRIIGAALTIIGCTTIGFLLATSVKSEIKIIQGLISILMGWKNNIHYYQTPLPELCSSIRSYDTSILRKLFHDFHQQLASNTYHDAHQIMLKVLSGYPELPQSCYNLLQKLGEGLGKYDSTGQLNEIDAVLNEANHILCRLKDNEPSQVKCYRAFGICAGVALAILII